MAIYYLLLFQSHIYFSLLEFAANIKILAATILSKDVQKTFYRFQNPITFLHLKILKLLLTFCIKAYALLNPYHGKHGLENHNKYLQVHNFIRNAETNYKCTFAKQVNKQQFLCLQTILFNYYVHPFTIFRRTLFLQDQHQVMQNGQLHDKHVLFTDESKTCREFRYSFAILL